MKVASLRTSSLRRPGFLALEGLNGAGKSSVQAAIAARIAGAGQRALITREPGGTPIGRELRRLLQESPEYRLESMSEVFLFAADRREHVAKVIRPALDRGEWVLSDRYLYSTLAFQGYGRGLSLPELSSLMEIAVDREYPDLVVLLDIDPLVGLRRVAGRAELDTFETEALDFHTRIREGFLRIAEERPEQFLVLDAGRPLEEVITRLFSVIDEWILK